MKDPFPRQCLPPGFTLLEVMVAMSIIAIAFTAVLGSQAQSVSLANEAKFNTTAPLLAQTKMAEITLEDVDDLMADSGDFGDDFPGYTWELSVQRLPLGGLQETREHLRRIDLSVSWGEEEKYRYNVRFYRFFPTAR